MQSGSLQRTQTDILSFLPCPPPVLSKDVQGNGTIVKSASHLHVSNSCGGGGGARERRQRLHLEVVPSSAPVPHLVICAPWETEPLQRRHLREQPWAGTHTLNTQAASAAPLQKMCARGREGREEEEEDGGRERGCL